MSSNDKFSKLNLLKKTDPAIYSVLQKMVPSPDTTDSAFKGGYELADLNLLRKISGLTGANISDAKSIFQLIPEMNICSQILVSAVISPKDSVTGYVSYESLITDSNPKMIGELIEVISDTLTNEFKFNDRVHSIAWDTIITHGSYPMAIIPESAIDAVINSHERINKESDDLSGYLQDIFNNSGNLSTMGYFVDPNPADRVNAEKTTLESLNHKLTNESSYFGKMKLFETDLNLESFSITLSDEQGKETVKKIEFDKSLFTNKMKEMLETVTLVDNIDILKLPDLHEKMVEDLAANRSKEAFEDTIMTTLHSLDEKDSSLFSFFEDDTEQVNNESANDNRKVLKLRQEDLYPNRRYRVEQFTELKTMDKLARKTIGHPSCRRFASRAVIPLGKPGEPNIHQGYLALVDETGYIVSEAPSTDYYMDFYQNQVINNQQVEQMQMGSFNGGAGRNSNAMMVEEELKALNRNYRRQFEKNIIQSIENGIMGKTVELSSIEEWYDIAFARSLANKRTQVLFIPKEQMTYFAVDYNNYGIGTSILDDSRILSACRIMISFANVMRTLDNAVGRQLLTINLDPKDQNPRRTVTNIWHEHLRTRLTNVLPITETSPVGAVRYLAAAGTQLQVSGNERYPALSVEQTQRESVMSKIDTEFDESLARRQINMFGLTPETVDAALSQADFAINIKNNSMSLTKRVTMIQQPLNACLTDFTKKFSSQSGPIVAKMAEIVARYAKEIPEEHMQRLKISKKTKPGVFINRVVKDFINHINAFLPSPETVIIENQITELETYEKAVDLAVENMINEDTVVEFDIGDVAGGDKIKLVKAALKQHFMRLEMQRKNFLPEVFKFLRNGEKGNAEENFIKYHAEHVKSIGGLIEEYVKLVSVERDKSNERMAKWAEKKGIDLETPESTETTDTSGDDLGGEDEFDLGGGGEDESLETGDENLSEEEDNPNGKKDEEEEDSSKDEDKDKKDDNSTSTTEEPKEKE